MSITVKLDDFGKIFLPKEIRMKLKAKKFELIFNKGHLELIPVKSPSALFGTLKDLDLSDLDEIHGEAHEFDR